MRGSGAAFAPVGLVTLTSDFGLQDGYVGAMKGVMLGVARGITLVDIAHEVPPQDLWRGGRALETACPRFPAGAVHLAVVDPGVGTDRAPVVVVAGGHALVGPDNGLFGAVLARLGAPGQAWRIDAHPWLLPGPSATFHGRDIFAPTAAALAAGLLAPDAVGPPHELTPAPAPGPVVREGGVLRAVVVGADRFGNLLTGVTREDLLALAPAADRHRLVVRLPDGSSVPLVSTYGAVAPGARLALIGSDGWLELAIRRGSARARLGLEVGDDLTVLVPPPAGA